MSCCASTAFGMRRNHDLFPDAHGAPERTNQRWFYVGIKHIPGLGSRGVNLPILNAGLVVVDDVFPGWRVSEFK